MIFKFLTLFGLFSTTFGFNNKIFSNDYKPLIRGSTAPFENSKIFNKNFIASGINTVFLREAELKHCRIAMLAAVILPTLEQFTDGLSIYQFQELPNEIQLGFVAMMFIGEFGSMMRGWENPLKKPFTLKENYQPGDFGFRLSKNDESILGVQMDKELNNGRLAMIAVLGMIVQELVTNQQLF